MYKWENGNIAYIIKFSLTILIHRKSDRCAESQKEREQRVRCIGRMHRKQERALRKQWLRYARSRTPLYRYLARRAKLSANYL